MRGEIKITDRQKEILNFIYSSLKNDGFPPTFDEIKESFGISSNQAVIDHLDSLEKKGLLIREKGAARGIKITPLGSKILKKRPLFPVGITSNAGPMAESINIKGEWKTTSASIAINNDVFIIRISGDSMINAGINDGDLLLAQPQAEFSSGDIVLAEASSETTIKRFIRENKSPYIYLKPENPKYKNILFTPETNVTMQAKIIAKLESNKVKMIYQGSFV